MTKQEQNLICFWNITEQYGIGILGGIQIYECVLTSGDRETIFAHNEDGMIDVLKRDKKIVGIELAMNCQNINKRKNVCKTKS